MTKNESNIDLPAPLSLTLDQLTEISGGMSLASITNVYIPHWLWFGQPPVVSLTGLQTVSIP